ncbi:MAG: hypothetical protein IPM96_04465 [Ignavibacteria bacterium]|nr:hypothetical protein [Ignavibacteria bacterium]
MDLVKIIEMNNIDMKTFNYFMNFIIKYKISRLSKSTKNEFVKVNFGIIEGLFFIASNDLIKDNIESSTKIEEISRNWYYFKEVY